MFSLCMVEFPLLGSGVVASDEEYVSTHFSPLLKDVFSGFSYLAYH